MSTVVDQVKNMMEAAFTSHQWGNKLLTAQGVDSRMLSDVAPMDDNIPPEGPQNVVTVPFLAAVSITWDAPRRYDYVTRACVEYTVMDGENEGDVVVIEVKGTNGTVIYDLDYVDHSFRVKFLDMWDHESEWSAPVIGKPNETAEYKIDLEKARQLGNVSSIMSLINGSLIAGDNFAEGTVRQISLATPEHPNQLPMIEVDFDQWPVETVWPPTDSPAPIDGVPQPPYITAIKPLGISAKVTEYAGRKWLEVSRSTATTPDPRMYPFAAFKRRETHPNNYYIASVYVQGDAGTQVRFGVEASENPEGTSVLNLAQTNTVTLDGSPDGQRIYFKFFMGNTHPYIRFRLDTVSDNKITRWTRFQLEQADQFKTQPGPWTPGVLSVGIVNARMLTAIDANIANGLFKNAAIESAAIKDLTANKITAGTLNAGEIKVASLLDMLPGVSGTGGLPPGLIRAGNTWMTAGGLSLLAQDSYYKPADYFSDRDLRSSAITGRNADGTSMESAIAFVDDTRPGFKYRGVVMRADGDSANDGLIALHATNGGDLSAQTTAKVEIRAAQSGGLGTVSINRKLNVVDNVTADNFVIPAKQGKDSYSLSSHKHDWSNDITDKPTLSNYIKDGDSVGSLKLGKLSLDGRNIQIEGGNRGYLFAVA